MTTEQLESSWSLNARRRVFHQYPNGAAPLMGLLSLVDEPEEGQTDKTEFAWEEQRFETFQYLTASANSDGPFTDTDGSDGAAGTDKTVAGWSASAGDTVRVQLAADSVDNINVRDVLQFRRFNGTASSVKTFQVIVSAVWAAQDTVDVYFPEAVANLLNDTTNNDLDVIMIGNAVAEADRSKSGFYTLPIEPSNYTQIFRQAFEFSRNALKEGLKFDAKGIYKEKAKLNALKHMKAMEYAAFWSDRTKDNTVTTDDSLDSQRRTMGGIHWFLYQWELGNTTNGGAFDYRPGGSDITASAWDADENKRILDFQNATITKDEFNDIIERAFRYNNDESFEKCCLCGGGLIKHFNKFVDQESLKTTKLSTKETYGMNVTTWESPFGVLHFKMHPLFNQTAVFRNSGFILDVKNIKYTPFQDADTHLLKMRQPRDFDGRKDEWLTEYGLEVRWPENHMFLDRLGGITS